MIYQVKSFPNEWRQFCFLQFGISANVDRFLYLFSFFLSFSHFHYNKFCCFFFNCHFHTSCPIYSVHLV